MYCWHEEAGIHSTEEKKKLGSVFICWSLVIPTFRGTFSRNTDRVLTTNSLIFSIANHALEFGPKLSILLIISARVFSDLCQLDPLGNEGLALLLGDTLFYQS